jgi:hypothetical protein
MKFATIYNGKIYYSAHTINRHNYELKEEYWNKNGKNASLIILLMK